MLTTGPGCIHNAQSPLSGSISSMVQQWHPRNRHQATHKGGVLGRRAAQRSGQLVQGAFRAVLLLHCRVRPGCGRPHMCNPLN
jgi:hypothetical protein